MVAMTGYLRNGGDTTDEQAEGGVRMNQTRRRLVSTARVADAKNSAGKALGERAPAQASREPSQKRAPGLGVTSARRISRRHAAPFGPHFVHVVVYMAGVALHVALGRHVHLSFNLRGVIIVEAVIPGQASQERFAAEPRGSAHWRRHGAQVFRAAAACRRCRVAPKPHAAPAALQGGHRTNVTFLWEIDFRVSNCLWTLSCRFQNFFSWT